ncbi:HAMP domain-containing histidine kinase [Patescibacteria group bacterium]|nr:HAMP domain-containing histidine kinase [Patescibacteria group bacterium]
MNVQIILNILVIVESLLLLVISITLFRKTSDFKKLKKYEEALIMFQANQNDVIPMLVHELRAPLSVVKGASDLLLKSTDEMNADQVRDLLAQIKSSSEGLLKMVGDILDVSKMEGGKFQISKVFGSLGGLLKEECAYFESLARVKEVSLSCATGENIPEFSFDPERVKQVMSNLLSNAIKFTPKGGSVEVIARHVDRIVEVVVEDTGIGVPEKDQPKLFHKFFQAGNQGGVTQKGTGLGLVITKGIVEAHGGKIWYEDNKPKGAKFIFALPLK